MQSRILHFRHCGSVQILTRVEPRGERWRAPRAVARGAAKEADEHQKAHAPERVLVSRRGDSARARAGVRVRVRVRVRVGPHEGPTQPRRLRRAGRLSLGLDLARPATLGLGLGVGRGLGGRGRHSDRGQRRVGGVRTRSRGVASRRRASFERGVSFRTVGHAAGASKARRAWLGGGLREPAGQGLRARCLFHMARQPLDKLRPVLRLELGVRVERARIP